MEIDVTVKNYRCFSDERPLRLTFRSGFTAFLGVNNAGKSSALKFFYEFRGLFQELTNPNAVMNAGRDSQGFNYRDVLDTNEVFHFGNNRGIEITFEFRPSKTGQIRQIAVRVPRGSNSFHLASVTADNSTYNSFPAQGTRFTGQGLTIGDAALGSLEAMSGGLQKLQNCLYVGAFRNAINVGAVENYFDIQTGQGFIKAWKDFKTGPLKVRNQAAFKVTGDIRRIFGYDSLDINASPDEKTLQLFVDGKSHWLSELGSGIAQFIIVLVNAAIRRPAYILIDEPKLNLHPSLQMDFLTTLASYAQDGIFFATHSYGLARASAERIHTFRKTEISSEVGVLEALPRLSEFLGELSYSGYRELGFDKVLLVEGATDIKTVHQWLRLFGKDHKVVVLSLGGSNMINASRELELQEIRRITGNIYVLVDSERDSPGAPLGKDRVAFQQLCEKLELKLLVLERRATENYFTDAAVKRAKGPKYKALESHEKLSEHDPGWGKEEGWRIAREMTLGDLNGTDIGAFLQSL